MHVHVRGNLVALWLACLAGPGSVAWADYVPVPIVEVGKPRLNDIAYSPDGGTLAMLTSEWVELLDADSFEEIRRFGSGGEEVHFSPDGSLLAVFGKGLPGRVYDVTTGALSEEAPVTPGAVSIAPDWSRIAYTDGDVVHVWERAAGAVVTTLAGDPEPFLRHIPERNGGGRTPLAHREPMRSCSTPTACDCSPSHTGKRLRYGTRRPANCSAT
ncbi:MAG: hypothetical protein ABGY41_21200, partial [Candidatus Poribacteria bacterium]